MRLARNSALLILVIVIASSARGKVRPEANCLGVVEAKENIASLNGSVVAICGWLRFAAEDQNIYPAKNDTWTRSDNVDCLSIGSSESLASDISEFDGQYVHVSGMLVSNFCPEGTLCLASCSQTGIFVSEIQPL